MLPLSPLSLHILVALAHEPLHGYAVIKEVARSSAGAVSPGAGTFYSAIKRMADSGLLEELASNIEQTAPGRPKRTFRLTSLGRQVMLAEATRLQRLVDEARASDGTATASPRG